MTTVPQMLTVWKSSQPTKEGIMQIDYQEYLDKIEWAKSDYAVMAAEATDESYKSYYNGILKGLEEASGLLAEVIDEYLSA